MFYYLLFTRKSLYFNYIGLSVLQHAYIIKIPTNRIVWNNLKVKPPLPFSLPLTLPFFDHFSESFKNTFSKIHHHHYPEWPVVMILNLIVHWALLTKVTPTLSTFLLTACFLEMKSCHLPQSAKPGNSWRTTKMKTKFIVSCFLCQTCQLSTWQSRSLARIRIPTFFFP